MNEAKTISVKELCQLWGISKPTAYALVRKEGFPAVHIGSKWLIPVRELEMWLAEEARNG